MASVPSRICRKLKSENVFEAKLKSRSQPKLGALAVTFPIPEERYENVILALQNLQIGDVRKQDCCIESIRAPDCPALLRMTNTMANVDELDWLAREMESFDRYEMLRFNAAAERFNLHCADELIDLTACFNEVQKRKAASAFEAANLSQVL